MSSACTELFLNLKKIELLLSTSIHFILIFLLTSYSMKSLSVAYLLHDLIQQYRMALFQMVLHLLYAVRHHVSAQVAGGLVIIMVKLLPYLRCELDSVVSWKLSIIIFAQKIYRFQLEILRCTFKPSYTVFVYFTSTCDKIRPSSM